MLSPLFDFSIKFTVIAVYDRSYCICKINIMYNQAVFEQIAVYGGISLGDRD